MGFFLNDYNKPKTNTMAKVDTIELTVNGQTHTYNINVGKDGMFKCKIPWAIAEPIGIKNSLEFKTLQELKSAILVPYHDYLESKKTEELLIWIKYKSSGEYSYYKDGSRMFPGNSNEFNLSHFAREIDGLAFDFGVIIKETASTGTVIWYEARKGQGSVYYQQQDKKDSNTYYKYERRHSFSGKTIPYSDKAMETLVKARNGIREISEILYRVMSQDEKQIEAILLGGKLLSQ